MSSGAVTGSRAWPTRLWPTVWDACSNMVEAGMTELVVGDCSTGADLWARRWAEFYQVPLLVEVADWDGKGKRAGPERNARIAEHQPKFAAAFMLPDAHIDSSYVRNRGTADCVRRLLAAGTRVVRFQAP